MDTRVNVTYRENRATVERRAHPMPCDTVCAAIRLRLSTLVASIDRGRGATAREAVRETMRAYGAHLRSSAVMPEHLVPPVRHMILDALLCTTVLRCDESAALVSDVVLWGIEGYYDAAPQMPDG